MRFGLRLSLVVLFSACLFSFPAASPLDTETGSGNDIAQLDFHGFSLDGDRLRFDYDIPFGGMVEIYLYNGAGKKVWYHHYVNEEGKNSISVRAAAFRPGQSYRFVLKYKLSEVSGQLPANLNTPL